MVEETILQHWIFTKFAFPFLLIFFIVFAVLEKTKILGDDKKQLDALVAFIIALIFVGAVYPKLVVSNLILFLTVALVVVFVVLLLWGFVSGGEAKIEGKAVKIVVGAIVVFAVILALLWATGLGAWAFEILFQQSWSKAFWTNALFLVVIVIAIALVLKTGKGGK